MSIEYFTQTVNLLANDLGLKVTNDGDIMAITLNQDNKQLDIDIICKAFNKASDSKYKPKGKEFQRLSKGLFKAGFTASQIIEVVNFMCNKWMSDPKMSAYCRPSTILRLNNFTNYFNEISRKPKNSMLDLLKDEWDD